MSTARGAKLKAQYNRVRTSTALRANNMWTNTIGQEMDPQAGSNSAIEAQIYAPGGGGGSNRAQRRELAQQLIQAAGYQPSVTDYQGLLTLAKAQGGLGQGTRGACKLCGGLGHMTKQCTNFLTGHSGAAGTDVVVPGGAAAAAGAAGGEAMGLLPDPGALSDLSDLSSDSDSDSSSSSSDSEAERRRRKEKKKKRKSSKDKGSKKSKKERREKDRDRKRSRDDGEERGGERDSKRSKKSKDKKSKKERRRERSGSGSDTD